MSCHVGTLDSKKDCICAEPGPQSYSTKGRTLIQVLPPLNILLLSAQSSFSGSGIEMNLNAYTGVHIQVHFNKNAYMHKQTAIKSIGGST